MTSDAEDQSTVAADSQRPVVEELRQLARWRMTQESAGHTLQVTTLVHEE